MAVDVGGSPYALPPSGSHPEDGLGYSRHYAQRIRDLGKSSKESWIKRLWNHMFSTKAKNAQHLEKPKNYHGYGGGNNGKNKGDDGIGAGSATDESDNKGGKGGAASKGDRSHRDNNMGSGSSKDGQYSARDGYSRHSAPARGDKFKSIPQELVNSPYLPPNQRPQYKVVKGRDSFNRESTNFKSKENSARSKDSSTKDNQNQRSKRENNFENNPYYKKQDREPTSIFLRKHSHPYLATHPDNWKPRTTRGVSMIQLEKRAKGIAETAMKNAQIFTCDGPYPVDAYVRFSLRKRGWVEKFGMKANQASVGSHRHRNSSNKLEWEVEEDFEAICERYIPPPWEEENGLYAMMSRIVRHYPAKFIWGGRGVNQLVLRKEVMVNHFQKARFFSSKVGLSNSLKELAWLNSADPSDFFPRCYILNEDEKEDFTGDYRLTVCISLLKWVLSMYTSPKSGDASKRQQQLCRENTKYEEVTFTEGAKNLNEDCFLIPDHYQDHIGGVEKVAETSKDKDDSSRSKSAKSTKSAKSEASTKSSSSNNKDISKHCRENSDDPNSDEEFGLDDDEGGGSDIENNDIMDTGEDDSSAETGRGSDNYTAVNATRNVTHVPKMQNGQQKVMPPIVKKKKVPTATLR